MVYITSQVVILLCQTEEIDCINLHCLQQVLKAPHGDLLTCMEMAKVLYWFFLSLWIACILNCKSSSLLALWHIPYLCTMDACQLQVADLLAFVASPKSLYEADDTDSFIDSFGSQCLSVFRAIGLPSTAVLICVRISVFHFSVNCLF